MSAMVRRPLAPAHSARARRAVHTLHDKPILAGEWATVTAQLIEWHDKATEPAVFVEVDEALTPAQVSELVRALVEASLILDRPHT